MEMNLTQCDLDPMNGESQTERRQKRNAKVALLLVGYADEVKKAMEFVFSETSVCKTNAVAEKVAFDRNVKTRSDTLEGDLFQPGGLMTGGFVRFAAPSLLGESGHLEIGSIREMNVRKIAGGE
ncbi:structural maintenance of chromosomes protein 2-1 [Tanacetum coccineum]